MSSLKATTQFSTHKPTSYRRERQFKIPTISGVSAHSPSPIQMPKITHNMHNKSTSYKHSTNGSFCLNFLHGYFWATSRNLKTTSHFLEKLPKTDKQHLEFEMVISLRPYSATKQFKQCSIKSADVGSGEVFSNIRSPPDNRWINLIV